MGLIQKFLRRTSATKASHGERPGLPNMARSSTQQELIAMAVRDALKRHGIPATWFELETFAIALKGNKSGLHLRLIMVQWQPRLVMSVVALQDAIRARLLKLDPLSGAWMQGVSWRFAPIDATHCQALPEPSYWKMLESESAPPKPATKARTPTVRERLDQLLSSSGSSGPPLDFMPTQPMFQIAEPTPVRPGLPKNRSDT